MKFYLSLALMIITSMVIAEENPEITINSSLNKLLPEVDIDSIQATPVKGLYQVLIGAEVFYITGDGRYAINKGELVDIQERVNLTERARIRARSDLIKTINEGEYIEFAPKKPSDIIYVFTDIDCGYCRIFHRDVPELNAKGISVRYLAYPRAGVNSDTGRRMGHVWCAEDRQKALTASKRREQVEPRRCDNPIARHYVLGQQLGLRGTPAIYLQNGNMFPGYMSPDRLIRNMRNSAY